MARGFLIFLLLLSSLPFGRPENKTPAECQQEAGKCYNKPAALRLKIIAIVSILFTSTVGVCLPLFSRSVPALMPDRNLFAIVKAFASGIILATGYMHVLPDSFACLTSVCLPDNPWHKFPFSTFVAMLSAVFTLLVESVSTSYYRKINAGVVKPARTAGDLEMSGCEQAAVSKGGFDSVLLKHRVVSQVLELGIVVHSVVIGLSLGATQNPCTIRPLIAALCFHQLFEGMGLGGCILQAEYTNKVKAIMVFFFSTTTPFGIVLGIGLSNVYSDNSPTALIVVGVLNASSAGLLNYMALVDLLAADFMGLKLQSNIKLQIQAFFAVLLGVGGMSLMAKWA